MRCTDCNVELIANENWSPSSVRREYKVCRRCNVARVTASNAKRKFNPMHAERAMSPRGARIAALIAALPDGWDKREPILLNRQFQPVTPRGRPSKG